MAWLGASACRSLTGLWSWCQLGLPSCLPWGRIRSSHWQDSVPQGCGTEGLSSWPCEPPHRQLPEWKLRACKPARGITPWSREWPRVTFTIFQSSDTSHQVSLHSRRSIQWGCENQGAGSPGGLLRTACHIQPKGSALCVFPERGPIHIPSGLTESNAGARDGRSMICGLKSLVRDRKIW